MKISVIVKGGGYDGMSCIKEIPKTGFEKIESIGIPVVDGRIANFPTLSISRKCIVLDGEKLTWEMWLKKIPFFFQGGGNDGQTGMWSSEKEVDVYKLKGGFFQMKIEGVGDVRYPILDVGPNGILLDGENSQVKE